MTTCWYKIIFYRAENLRAIAKGLRSRKLKFVMVSQWHLMAVWGGGGANQ